ncbi:MAG: hypothetical protein RI964_1780 [Pseudomonadota bacterium]|jgi:4-amino-4-deoxy-L-arabinose transferase-like glycosyltransferase
MMQPQRLRQWLTSGDVFLLPLVALAFFWQLGTPALFDLDEGAFSAATWEMFQRGDFITTFLDGEPRFDKPILIYWLQALSVWSFGLHEWSLRLPSALAASAWVSATYYFAKPRLSPRSAMMAAVMVACSAMIVLIGRAAIADALLNLLLALTLFDIWRYWEQPRHHLLLRIFLWLGLGFLCKGPIAVAIPLVVSGCLYIAHGQWQAWWRTLLNPYGLLLFIAVAAPWYVLEYQAQGQAFIDGFFFKHNLKRFSDTMEGHGGSVWYYLMALPFIILPFSGLLLSLFKQLPQLIQQPWQRFLWCWFGFVLVFFSFSNTQLPHYLLYGITPLLLLLAQYTGENPNRWLAVLPALVMAGILCGLPELLVMAVQQNPSAYFSGLLDQAQPMLGLRYRLAAGLYAFALLLLLFWPNVTGFVRLCGVAIMQTVFLTSVLIPLIAHIQQSPVKAAAQFAQQHLENATIVMDGIDMPSFTVYRQHITPHRPPQRGEYVFTNLEYLVADPAANPAQPQPSFTVVFQQGGLALAQRIH